MSNKARGFIDVDLNGEKLSIGLPMGAMAYIESEYKVNTFEQAIDFVIGDNVSASKAMKFLFTVFKANDFELTPERIKAINNWSATTAMETMVELLKVSGFISDSKSTGGNSERPLVVKNAGKRG